MDMRSDDPGTDRSASIRPALTRRTMDPVRERATPERFCTHGSDTARNGLPVVDVLRTTTRASELDDASGACCDDDDAAERGSDE